MASLIKANPMAVLSTQIAANGRFIKANGRLIKANGFRFMKANCRFIKAGPDGQFIKASSNRKAPMANLSRPARTGRANP